MTDAAVFRRLDGDHMLTALLQHAGRSVCRAEELAGSSCFCVKNRKWVKTQSLKQLAGHETGSVREMHVFEKTKKDFISGWPCGRESSHAQFVFMHRMKPATISLYATVNSFSRQPFSHHGTSGVVRLTLGWSLWCVYVKADWLPSHETHCMHPFQWLHFFQISNLDLVLQIHFRNFPFFTFTRLCVTWLQAPFEIVF